MPNDLLSKLLIRSALLAAAVALLPGPVRATSFYSLTGQVAPETRLIFNGGEPDWALFSTPDARLHLRATPTDELEALLSTELDLRFNAADGWRWLPDARELWVRAYVGDFTLTAGRQLFSWGSIGDYGVVDILNPQQLVDPGQGWADRKQGSWGFRTDWELDSATLEAYLIPVAARSSLSPATPWLETTLGSGAPVGSRTDLDRQPPSTSIKGTQAALRAYVSLDRADVGAGLAQLNHQLGLVALDQAGQLAIRYGKWVVLTGEASIPFLEGYSAGLESALMLSEDGIDGSENMLDGARLHAAARVKGFLSSSLQFELGALIEQVLRPIAAPAGVTGAGATTPAPAGNPLLNLDDRIIHTTLVYRFGDTLHSVTLGWAGGLRHGGHLLQPGLTLRLLDGLLFNGGFLIATGDTAGLARFKSFSSMYTSLRVDF